MDEDKDIRTPPTFEVNEVIELCRNKYGLEVTSVSSLVSYEDQNFRISVGDQKYLLKIQHKEQNEDHLEFQNLILKHLEKKQFNAQKIIKTKQGEDVFNAEKGGNKFKARLLTYLEGKVFADFNPQSEELLTNFGEYLAGFHNAMEDFVYEGNYKPSPKNPWVFFYCNNIFQYLYAVKEKHSEQRSELVKNLATRYVEKILPKILNKRNLMHGDANDLNILVNNEGTKVSGLIDFGDSNFGDLSSDVGIAMAYLMMSKDDPLAAGKAILRGYLKHRAISKEDMQDLILHIKMRICISVTMSAFNQILQPDNEYIKITEKPGWSLLEYFEEQGEEKIVKEFVGLL